MLQDKTYLNPELSIEERTENLLAQMNLMDKIGQMNQVWGLEQMKEFGGPDPEDMARKGLAGSMLYLLNKEKRKCHSENRSRRKPMWDSHFIWFGCSPRI